MRSDAEPSARRSIGQRVRGIGGGASIVPLLILFGLNAVDELDRTAFGLLLPEIQDEFDLGLTGVTALTAAIIPAALIVAVPLARLADRWKRVPLAIGGASVWALFSVFTGLVPTVTILIFARIGAGLGRAVNDPVHGSLLSDYYPPTARAKVFAGHRAANVVGAFCGPFIAGFIAAAFGWRIPFFILAVPTLVLVVAALIYLREPPRTGRSLQEGEVPRLREAFKVLWGVQTLRWIWLAFPFIAFVAIGLGPLGALYYNEVFGVGPGPRGVIQAFDAPFIVIGLLIGSPMVDRGIASDPGKVMRNVGFGAAAIALLILGAATAPALGVGIAFFYAINVVAFVLYAAGFAIVSLAAPPEARASAFAFFNISSLFGIVSLPIVGIVGDALGIRWGMAVLTPILLIGGFILSRAGKYVNEDVARVNPVDEVPPETALPGTPPMPPDLSDPPADRLD